MSRLKCIKNSKNQNLRVNGSLKRINKNPKHPYRKEFTLYPTEVKELKEIVENYRKIINENKEVEEDE